MSAQATMLEQVLAGFRIKGRVVSEHVGPMLTLFSVQVPSGVKLRSVQNIAADIARQIRAVSCVVTQAPVLGVLIFEVSRSDPQTVTLAHCIPELQRHSRMALPIALGVHTNGRPVIVDLEAAPHMLIAGTTGSGKSVLLNAIIMSLICNKRPDELKLVLIDPKRIELTPYEGIPHMTFSGVPVPVITTPEKSIVMLNNLIGEMEDRYDALAREGVRSIAEYNKRACHKMPRIVAIVDEFGDLMLAAGYEVEQAVMMLAQKARAVGIHLILATQRPSVDVVTGVIKANFPMRVCLRVSSKTDSRVVLDHNGAEALLGRGDMLFTGPGVNDPLRAHAPLVGMNDINMAVNKLRGA